jgi:hypothetical protein
MKLKASCVAWFMPLLLSACIHKTNQSQVQPLAPPIEDTPLTKPDTAPVNLPPPVVTIPTAPASTTAKTEDVPARPLPKHKKSPPKVAVAPPAQAPTQQAANNVPEVPAAGQLTSGETPNLTKQTEDSISEIERTLNAITRKLNDGEVNTSSQIKEYLKQARTALASGDADGAHTLAMKAKVLLNELSK